MLEEDSGLYALERKLTDGPDFHILIPLAYSIFPIVLLLGFGYFPDTTLAGYMRYPRFRRE
jgi:hypothetical protein